jgi:molybdopterin synthase sulfur carrier subunit
MQIQVKYFAAIREALSVSGEVVQTSATTLAALRDELIARSDAHAQALARGKAVRVALNQVMQDETAALSEGCEVAFFPPVTGG